MRGRITYWTGKRRPDPSAVPPIRFTGTDSRCSIRRGAVVVRGVVRSDSRRCRRAARTPGSPRTSSDDHPSAVVSVLNSARDVGEHVGRVVDQVDLVHRQHQLRHAEQREHRGVPRVCSMTPLRASTSRITSCAVEAPETVLRVYCTCPGVSASTNERLRRGEVAVRHVDGDALFTLRAQAVDQQRQVRCGQPLVDRRAGDGVDLVGENRFRVVQQPADEGRLAVVDAARGGEPSAGRSCQK